MTIITNLLDIKHRTTEERGQRIDKERERESINL